VTVTDTVAASYLSTTSACAGSAAEAAAKRKEDKYVEISSNYHSFPLAFEAFRPINQVGSCALGQRLSLISDDPRETSFLFQRLHHIPNIPNKEFPIINEEDIPNRL